MKRLICFALALLLCFTLFACENDNITAEETEAETILEETFINPVANGADPFVFKDTDGTYYMYMTSGGTYGYRVYTSMNLVEWEAQGY